MLEGEIPVPHQIQSQLERLFCLLLLPLFPGQGANSTFGRKAVHLVFSASAPVTHW